MASIAAEALAPIEVEDSDAFRRRIERRPLGVVLVVAPWNYPFLTAINTSMPVLMVGNSVIPKHASQTLAVGTELGGKGPPYVMPDADLIEKLNVEWQSRLGSLCAWFESYRN